MVENTQLWQACLIDLENEVSKPNLTTWFKNTVLLNLELGTAYIGVPNDFVKEWLQTKFHKLILKTLMNHDDSIRAIEYEIVKTNQVGTNKKGVPEVSPQSLPLQDLYVNKEDNLNSRYIFESFIVGSFNELAYAASQAIVKNPGTVYNPFFIFGNTGLGKTHLIQSIGNAIKQNFPNKKVHYTTTEKFYIDYINALQGNKISVFKEKYRRFDVLIIDDIQFVTTKTKTQEELFHVFNTLHEQNKQIIFSSDKHPNFIPGLEDRLRSRFQQGMIVEVLEPDYESRMAIIKQKLESQKIHIAQDVLEFVAETVEGSIRELEGIANNIILQQTMRKKVFDLSEAKILLKNTTKPKKQVSIEDVVKKIATFYNLNESIIYEKTRRKEIVRARQIIMYILREEFSISFPLIGQKLGGKDHTTVIHSCEKVRKDLENNPSLQKELDDIKILFR